jgi:flagellar hook-basal body complex protein FliE
MAVNGVGATSALMELRAAVLAQHADLRQAAAASTPAAPASFAEALRVVDSLQKTASAATTAYERGETNDLVGVMLARQQSSLAFEATLQVRNRLLSAYRDIMNMPV